MLLMSMQREHIWITHPCLFNPLFKIDKPQIWCMLDVWSYKRDPVLGSVSFVNGTNVNKQKMTVHGSKIKPAPSCSRTNSRTIPEAICVSFHSPFSFLGVFHFGQMILMLTLLLAQTNDFLFSTHLPSCGWLVCFYVCGFSVDEVCVSLFGHSGYRC